MRAGGEVSVGELSGLDPMDVVISDCGKSGQKSAPIGELEEQLMGIAEARRMLEGFEDVA